MQRTTSSVRPGAQGEVRLVTVFLWQLRHLRVRHVGRIGNDHVVDLPVHGLEDIATMQMHAILHVVPRNIDGSDLERRRRDVDRIDPRLGELEGAGNGDAAGARADIQHPAHVVRLDPRRKPRVDREWRPRNDHA